MSTLTTYFKIALEVVANAIRQFFKKAWTRMEEVKLFPFADDTTVYVENPQKSIKQLLKLMNEVIKFVG